MKKAIRNRRTRRLAWIVSSLFIFCTQVTEASAQAEKSPAVKKEKDAKGATDKPAAKEDAKGATDKPAAKEDAKGATEKTAQKKEAEPESPATDNEKKEDTTSGEAAQSEQAGETEAADKTDTTDTTADSAEAGESGVEQGEAANGETATESSESQPQDVSNNEQADAQANADYQLIAEEEVAVATKKFWHMVLITYDMAIPVGSTRDYISDFSPRGMSFEYRFHFTPELSVGGLWGWNNFDTKEKGSFNYDNVTITGTQVRNMDVMPIAATLHYNILPINGKIIPYVGLDLGAYRLWRTTDFGWWILSTQDWHFGLSPGLGVAFHIGSVALTVGTKYHAVIETNDSDGEMFVEFNLGVALIN